MRFRIALSALAALLLFPGCDSVFGSDGIDGVWESREEEDGYLVIDTDNERLAGYFETTDGDGGDCYFSFEADIESLGGDEYRVRSEGESETVTIRRDDDVLIVEFEEGGDTNTERYDESNLDENDLRPICSFDVLTPETRSIFGQ